MRFVFPLSCSLSLFFSLPSLSLSILSRTVGESIRVGKLDHTWGRAEVCVWGGSLEREQGIVRGVCDTYQDHSPIWLYILLHQGSPRPSFPDCGTDWRKFFFKARLCAWSIALRSHFSFLNAIYLRFRTVFFLLFFSIQGLSVSVTSFLICFLCLSYSVSNRLFMAPVCAANRLNSPPASSVIRPAIVCLDSVVQNPCGVTWCCWGCQSPSLPSPALSVLLLMMSQWKIANGIGVPSTTVGWGGDPLWSFTAWNTVMFL